MSEHSLATLRNSGSTARPLRVLFAGDTRTIHSVRLVAALARRGVDVRVLNGRELVRRIGREYQADARTLSYAELQLPGRGRIPGIGRLEWGLNRLVLRLKLQQPRFDVVHVNNLFCGQRLDRLTWLNRLPAPMVVTAWGSDVDDSAVKKHPTYPPLRKALLSQATLITAWSEPMVRRCRDIVAERPERDFRLIRWHPDPTAFNVDVARRGRIDWRERLGISDNDLVFLSPRNSRPNYQIDRIIRAFSRGFGPNTTDVARSRHRTLLLVMVSEPTRPDLAEYLDRLRSLAAPLGDRVRFIDQVPHTEVASLFSAADAAISIPQADGGPATHAELMALGVPLIVGDLEDYRDQTVHGENALIVDATRDEPVTDAMLRYAYDVALRERIRTTALQRSQGTFDQTVDAYLRSYHDAIARASAPIRAPMPATANAVG